jgi:hypothetical protein
MKPYHVDQDATGQWRVVLYDKPVALTFDLEAQADTLCLALNEAFRTGHELGYNAGYDSATRQHFIG